MSLPALRAAGALLDRNSKRTQPGASRLPLASLVPRLDRRSAGVRWNVHPDGVLGRALLMPIGTTFTVPLRLANEVSFSARAMLLPHDWRDGRDALRVTAMITDADGHRAEIWSGLLRASDRGR